MRLGFAVKVLGQPDLKSNDSRRWQNGPHLSVSLAYVRDILLYLRKVGVRMYRLSSELAPYVTHPGLPQFHRQIADCHLELEAIGEMAREDDIRLSFHPGAHVILNSPDETIVARSTADLISQAQMLDLMGADQRAVIVVHVGGVYDDRRAAMERFIDTWHTLPERVQARLALENDEHGFSVEDIYQIHRHTGIWLVFDHLHHLNNNPSRLTRREATMLCLNTWPASVTPKVHFSSPRTEMRVMEKRSVNNRREHVLKPPLWSQHADFINPWEFIGFLEQTAGLRDFDIMLETKGKDLALLRLRQDLNRFAPEHVSRLE